MNEKIFFGIDGGGTFSRIALINSDGKVLTKSEAGSTNIYSVTKDEVFKNLSQLLDSAMKTTRLEKQNLTAGCIGSAGLAREREKIIFREFADRLLGKDFPVLLCSDAEILLCGGLENPEGYCLIAGTGSIALGRSSSGKLVRSGGYGYMIGDEGSAAWIGKTAIARIMRSIDNRDLPTDMSGAILEAAGLTESSELIHYIHYTADKAQVASLAPVVTDAARKGDPLALDILHKGAAELTLLVKSVIDQSPWIIKKELVLAGGVIKNNEILTQKLKEHLTNELPALSVYMPKGTALEGACMLAREVSLHNAREASLHNARETSLHDAKSLSQ